MVNEFVNNPQDPLEERVSWLEAQVIDINHNVSLTIEILINNLELFEEVGGSNAEVRLKGKLAHQEELERESKK